MALSSFPAPVSSLPAPISPRPAVLPRFGAVVPQFLTLPVAIALALAAAGILSPGTVRAQTPPTPALEPPISWRYVPYPEEQAWYLEYEGVPGFSYVIEESQDLTAWAPMAGGFSYGDGSTVRKFITKGPMPGNGGPPPAAAPPPGREFRSIVWTLTMAASPDSSQVHLRREAAPGYPAWDRVLDLPLPRLPAGPGGASPAPRLCFSLDFEDESHTIWSQPTVKTATAAAPQPADTLAYGGAQEDYELNAFLSTRDQLIAWLDNATNPPAPDTTPRPHKFLRIRRIGAADSNNNGIPDWQEQRWGFNVFTTGIDPNGDLDGDGYSNKTEMDRGTDPRVPDPPELNLTAALHNITLHLCKLSGSPPKVEGSEKVTSDLSVYSRPKNGETTGYTYPASWGPGSIPQDLRNILARAVSDGGDGKPAGNGFDVKPFGGFASAEGKLLLAYTDGRYSTSPVTFPVRPAGSPPPPPYSTPDPLYGGSYLELLDGHALEMLVRLKPSAASPVDISRRFILLGRNQSVGLPITDTASTPAWSYPAPICSDLTTLTVYAGKTDSGTPAGINGPGGTINRLALPDLNSLTDGQRIRSERTLAEISLLADSSRDGVISARDHYAIQPAVYTVNYGITENRTNSGGFPVEDAIHFDGEDDKSGTSKLYYDNGEPQRRIEAKYEDWRLPPQVAGSPLPKNLSPLRIPSFPFGHKDMKVYLRLPAGQEAKTKTFHLYIAKTNNTGAPVSSVTRPTLKVAPGSTEWVPVWGGITAPAEATAPGVPANIRDSFMDITKWVNPSAPGYVDTRPASAPSTSSTAAVPYEFALEGILFKGMPYPGDDGIARYGDPASPNPVFDGVLRIGIEFHMGGPGGTGGTNPGSNTPTPGNKEISDKAIGQYSDWVTLTCVPSIPMKMENGSMKLVNGTVAQDIPQGTGPDGSQIDVASPQIPAFTGAGPENSAQGYGKYAIGGRYGHVFTVTKKTDDANDPGTLRYAIESPIPRTIIFALPEGTDGNIELTKDLFIKDRECTIAGQTAFRNGSAGICLKKYGLRVEADDVIVRHIRSRPGNTDSPVKGEGGNTDCFSIEGVATRVIFDHCSASFSSDCLMDVITGISTDGNRATRPNRGITVQNCLLAWPMDKANHWEINKKGVSEQQEHGYGTLAWMGHGAKLTLWRNFYGHVRTRIPRARPTHLGTSDPVGLQVDTVNNVIYGWGDKEPLPQGKDAGYDDGEELGDTKGKYNFILNAYKTRIVRALGEKRVFRVKNRGASGWLTGNISVSGFEPNYTASYSDQYGANFVRYEAYLGRAAADYSSFGVSSAFASGVYTVPIQAPAAFAQDPIIRSAGACLLRDALDVKLCGRGDGTGEFYSRSGSMINSPSEVGGWPFLEATESPTDTDGDGLPDQAGTYTEQNAREKTDPRNALLDNDHDGHTNLEEYLNSLANP